ncbi:MAG: hypothetical protein ACXWXT_09220 [Candidatus Binatia bacterium]
MPKTIHGTNPSSHQDGHLVPRFVPVSFPLHEGAWSFDLITGYEPTAVRKDSNLNAFDRLVLAFSYRSNDGQVTCKPDPDIVAEVIATAILPIARVAVVAALDRLNFAGYLNLPGDAADALAPINSPDVNEVTDAAFARAWAAAEAALHHVFFR